MLAVAVVLFAVSTIIAWSYYGEKSWTYLFGKSKGSEMAYRIIFCLFTVVGSVLTPGSVLDFTDAVLFAPPLFTIIGLYLLAPVVKRELVEFRVYLESERVEDGIAAEVEWVAGGGPRAWAAPSPLSRRRPRP